MSKEPKEKYRPKVLKVDETIDHLKADMRTCQACVEHIIALREDIENYSSRQNINMSGFRRFNAYLNNAQEELYSTAKPIDVLTHKRRFEAEITNVIDSARPHVNFLLSQKDLTDEDQKVLKLINVQLQTISTKRNTTDFVEQLEKELRKDIKKDNKRQGINKGEKFSQKDELNDIASGLNAFHKHLLNIQDVIISRDIVDHLISRADDLKSNNELGHDNSYIRNFGYQRQMIHNVAQDVYSKVIVPLADEIEKFNDSDLGPNARSRIFETDIVNLLKSKILNSTLDKACRYVEELSNITLSSGDIDLQIKMKPADDAIDGIKAGKEKFDKTLHKFIDIAQSKSRQV